MLCSSAHAILEHHSLSLFSDHVTGENTYQHGKYILKWNCLLHLKNGWILQFEITLNLVFIALLRSESSDLNKTRVSNPISKKNSSFCGSLFLLSLISGCEVKKMLVRSRKEKKLYKIITIVPRWPLIENWSWITAEKIVNLWKSLKPTNQTLLFVFGTFFFQISKLSVRITHFVFKDIRNPQASS